MSDTIIDDIELAIKREFLLEAGELVELLEESFLTWEREGVNQGLMDAVFRHAHTIKGSGMAAGFDHLAAFAHEMEALLDLIRSGQVEADQSYADLFLACNDRFRQYLNGLQNDYEFYIDCADLVTRLRQRGASPSQNANADSGAAADASASRAGTVVTVPATPQAQPTKAQAPTAKPTVTAPSPTPEKSSPPKVLVCDDEDDIRDLFADYIKDFGYIPVPAEHGRAALEIVANQEIDLILTDLKMPEMDGLEFVRELRKIKCSQPVIFISGYAERDDMMKFIELGVFDFLEKPIEGRRLKIALKNAIAWSQLRAGVVKLSALNFKTYMTMTKILHQHSEVLEQVEPANLQQLEGYLQQIQSLTHGVVGDL